MAEDVLRTAEISEQDSGFALGLMGTCVLVRACRSLRSELPGECGSRAAKLRVIIARGGRGPGINAAGTELLPAALLGNSTRKKRLSMQQIVYSSLLGAHNSIHAQKLPPSSSVLNAMARDRIHVRCFGTAFVAWYVLATVSIGIADAATKEEVARCRAIEQRSERLDCFKALKQPAPAKTEGAVPANAEGPPTKTEDGAPAKAGDTTKPPPTSVEPATTSAINRLSTAPGQPVCVDRDALAAALVAGLLTSNPKQAATPGCQTLPSDAKLELLERHPGVFPFMRMVKVKVTSPTKPDLTVGFTIEMGPSANDGSSLKSPQ